MLFLQNVICDKAKPFMRRGRKVAGFNTGTCPSYRRMKLEKEVISNKVKEDRKKF